MLDDANVNMSWNPIMISSPSPPVNALYPSPSVVPYRTDPVQFDLSSQQHQQPPPHQLLSKFDSSKPPLPTNIYLLFKDGFSNHSHANSNHHGAHKSSVTLHHTVVTDGHYPYGNGSGATSPPSTKFFRAGNHFWSDIFTASLSPRVETSVEYVLIGMLGFVLLQIVIAYLLASEIRTLRSELAMLTSIHSNKTDSEDETEMANLRDDTIEHTICQLEMPNKDEIGTGFVELQPTVFSCYTAATGAFGYCDPNSVPISQTGYCMVTFEPTTSLVQVHTNPEVSDDANGGGGGVENGEVFLQSTTTSKHGIGNPLNCNYAGIITDPTLKNPASQLATTGTASATIATSTMTTMATDEHQHHTTSTLNRTNRRNRNGSFRVTFDSAPEYFDSNSEVYLVDTPTSIATTATNTNI